MYLYQKTNTTSANFQQFKNVCTQLIKLNWLQHFLKSLRHLHPSTITKRFFLSGSTTGDRTDIRPLIEITLFNLSATVAFPLKCSIFNESLRQRRFNFKGSLQDVKTTYKRRWRVEGGVKPKWKCHEHHLVCGYRFVLLVMNKDVTLIRFGAFLLGVNSFSPIISFIENSRGRLKSTTKSKSFLL